MRPASREYREHSCVERASQKNCGGRTARVSVDKGDTPFPSRLNAVICLAALHSNFHYYHLLFPPYFLLSQDGVSLQRACCVPLLFLRIKEEVVRSLGSIAARGNYCSARYQVCVVPTWPKAAVNSGRRVVRESVSALRCWPRPSVGDRRIGGIEVHPCRREPKYNCWFLPDHLCHDDWWFWGLLSINGSNRVWILPASSRKRNLTRGSYVILCYGDWYLKGNYMSDVWESSAQGFNTIANWTLP